MILSIDKNIGLDINAADIQEHVEDFKEDFMIR